MAGTFPEVISGGFMPDAVYFHYVKTVFICET